MVPRMILSPHEESIVDDHALVDKLFESDSE